MNQNMSPDEFREAARQAEVLDVRTAMEYEMGHIPGSRNIDISSPEFVSEIDALDRDRPYALYCRSGSRSASAIEIMDQMGFAHVGHLETGLLGWDGELTFGKEE
ncbi:MAG: rhodanese-like domain-containing protein [Spirochaetaceae bacterium]